jgi:FlaA1/EpsC-like NDP-sugar epimerase
VASAEPIIVWGAGLHTQKLLASSKLQRANIACFVDSDTGYDGATLAGLPIQRPADIRTKPQLPIVISSETYQTEILNQIREMGLPNEVVLLYDTGT